MEERPNPNITQQLLDWTKGSRDAFGPEIYHELCTIARARLRVLRAGHSLEPASVVNEAFLRLIKSAPGKWQHRGEFYAAASVLMRSILVDYCRARVSRKRGGGQVRIPLEDATGAAAPTGYSVEAVDKCIEELARLDERQAKIAEMRFFGGLTVQEVSEALGISEATVKRDASVARAWIAKRLAEA
jgi:RNA polymerase sigma factor (TIGR02999 family)